MIYEKHRFDARTQNKPLYGWDRDWEYRHTDVFPALARDGTLAYTEKQQGNSSIVVAKPDGSARRVIYNPAEHGYDPKRLAMGLGEPSSRRGRPTASGSRSASATGSISATAKKPPSCGSGATAAAWSR